MDRLEFLVEEESMAEILKVLLPQILSDSWKLNENYFIRPHQGKQDLKRSIANKLIGFARMKHIRTGFFIMQDQDSNDCRVLKQDIINICKQHSANNIGYLVRIVCHELEAWYLGDMFAIQSVFPPFNSQRYANSARFRVPDNCVNPCDELKKIVGDYSQIGMAKKIAPCMSITRNISKSFQQFVSGVTKLANM